METQGGSSAGFKGGKAETYEGGMRVPAIFSMPGTVPEGATAFDVVSSLDLYRTFADMAAVSLAAGEAPDSTSFACLLNNSCMAAPRHPIYYLFEKKPMAIR
jgi:arylsulfatase A-like enzyme